MAEMPLSELKLTFVDSISQLEEHQFNQLIKTDYPFIQYDFLDALENSNCVSVSTGWQPKHLAAYVKDRLIGFVPLYLKTHSYGEYVFDFQWANAYQQSGLSYYPKLLTAIPFTPCTGPRLIVAEEYGDQLSHMMMLAILDELERLQVSSYHLLFPSASDNTFDEPKTKLLERIGTQYHWYNQSYANFDEFLNRCKMKQRKNIKRERKAIFESNIELRIIEGDEITQELWSAFFYFYRLTYAKRSGNAGYLSQSFFTELGKTMPQNLMMAVANVSDQIVAASLFFKDSDTLYGRYWGTSVEIEYLHFELCYYQGIEYCINNSLKHFDAGAQGEHKIQRGFEPIETYSYHWIKDVRFRDAIQHFLAEESLIVKKNAQYLSKKLPYKLT